MRIKVLNEFVVTWNNVNIGNWTIKHYILVLKLLVIVNSNIYKTVKNKSMGWITKQEISYKDKGPVTKKKHFFEGGRA